MLVCALVCITCGKYFEKGFPVYTGEISGSGVKSEISIARDAAGIPHIKAANESDLYFAQGFVHAQDRLWQMDVIRRVAQGRLAEIAGEKFVDIDICARLLGLDDAVVQLSEQASPAALRIIKAYCRGINYYIKSNKENLPLEFNALDYVPPPFEPSDIFSVMVVNSWFLNQNYLHEVLALLLHDRFTTKDFNTLLPAYPGATFPPDTYFDNFQQAKIAPLLPALSVLRGKTEFSKNGGGSNIWVASGTKTKSGKPILANDPHLALTVPSVWYFNHLSSPQVHCTGASMPGAPSVIIGHNEAVTWGFTNVMADYVDLVLLKVDPENPVRYEVDGEMLEMGREEIEIKRRKDDPLRLTIYQSIHGPVISTMEPGYDLQVALKWIIQSKDNSLEAFLKLNRARTVTEALDAGKLIGHIGLNLIAADTSGDIGWQMTGNFPIRQNYSGRFPADGSRSSFNWLGFIPTDDLPRKINPPEGMIYTSNNRVLPHGYPYSISYAWAAPYRAQRVAQLLAESDSLSVEKFKEIQRDDLSIQAQKLIPQLAPSSPTDPDAKWAIDELRKWDCRVAANSRGALIFEQFLIAFTRALVGDEMQQNIAAYFDCFHFSYLIFDEILFHPNSRLWDRIDTPQNESAGEIVETALRNTVLFLSEKLGSDREQWTWGKQHKILYEYPGGQSWFTGMYLNEGPFEIGGDQNTVNAASFTPTGDYYKVKVVPSLRMIVDMANLDNSLIIGTMGQSGQPRHSHYKDMIEKWMNHDYLKMHFSADDLETIQKALLLIKP
ncbi:penicillin acylase family protein [candidate division KSB1 bacterium]|nr:penicillin acylase family protein [candidate division KSB1 bacterium]